MITAVALKPLNSIEVLPTENPRGLRYAVVYNNKYVLALFDDRFWAEEFIAARVENILKPFSIREVAE